MSFSRSATCAFLLSLTAPAFAQSGGEPSSAPSADPHAWALWTSCSVFFAAIIVFLIVTHRRTSRDLARIEQVERRLDALEKSGG